ncbi:heme exporter protein CcmD [Echinimonas agarilytica]|uniref:Heme exporter protein D n=1 Tax=Echinimonas agarilytica TaxID=1215918 RepID=A0AA42B6Y5_9GAMM|nr:heme exporter protein CcmD [Echinimonas agarilytica]MCM2679001.1 heme exporter protein CcmD [Echinimonas agarilytica]
MFFDSMSEFWHMGGYGFYVWLSFGATLICFVGAWAHTVYTRKKIIAGVRSFQERRARRKSAAKTERVL